LKDGKYLARLAGALDRGRGVERWPPGTLPDLLEGGELGGESKLVPSSMGSGSGAGARARARSMRLRLRVSRYNGK
jgi:hypothetical protein